MDFRKVNTIIVYSLLAIITLVTVFFVIYNANWTWGDDYEFLISTAVGKIEWSLHIANMGRFYPFGHFDYNMLVLMPGGTSATAHYILVAISMIVFVIASYILYFITLKEANRGILYKPWLIFGCVVFLLYYFFRLFFFLVYPERIIVVLLTLFVLSYYKFNKDKKSSYAIIAVIIAIYLTYCKETMFVIFTVLSVLNFLFGYKKLTMKQKIFHITLLFNTLIFLVLYYFITFRHTTVFYPRPNNFIDIIPFSLGNLKLLYFGLILSIWRLYRLIYKQDKQHLFFDSMLFSGLMYAFATITLNLQMVYYYYPAVLLVFPALIYWSSKIINPKWISLIVFVILVYYGRKIPTAIYNVQGMRITTHKHVETLSRYIKDARNIFWYERKKNNTINAGIEGYQKEILNVYVHFYENSIESIPFQIINLLPDSVPGKTVVFYSDYNNLDQSDELNWNKEMKKQHIDKLNLNNIHEISIYYKK